MMMTAVPSSDLRLAMISSSCACTVTSSDVVGSSAMSSSGLQLSAMAIMMRCCIPPLNWCG